MAVEILSAVFCTLANRDGLTFCDNTPASFRSPKAPDSDTVDHLHMADLAYLEMSD